MGNSRPLAIYIHWPYCARICPYCDFNVYKGARNEKLVEAILEDLARWREKTGIRNIHSIHFGGGTPSLMSSDNVADIIQSVENLWGLSRDLEIGLEANPIDADLGHWTSLSDAGINRLSLGVQSFKDNPLKFLGRDHDGNQARKACEIGRDVFQNLSVDLIFGWADQSILEWQEDLHSAIALKPDHISTYQLTIENGTAFERAERRGLSRAVASDESAELYNLAVETLRANKYEHYEISNFARVGHRSQHNLAYWRGYDYVGVGPGAHGRLTENEQRFETVALLRPEAYMDDIANSGELKMDALTSEEWGAEYLMMGLRINEGISMTQFETISGQVLDPTQIDMMRELELIYVNGDNVKVTPKGRPLLDTITRTLLS